MMRSMRCTSVFTPTTGESVGDSCTTTGDSVGDSGASTGESVGDFGTMCGTIGARRGVPLHACLSLSL